MVHTKWLDSVFESDAISETTGSLKPLPENRKKSEESTSFATCETIKTLIIKLFLQSRILSTAAQKIMDARLGVPMNYRLVFSIELSSSIYTTLSLARIFIVILRPVVLKRQRVGVKNFSWIGTVIWPPLMKTPEGLNHSLILSFWSVKIPMSAVSIRTARKKKCFHSLSLAEKQRRDQVVKEVSLTLVIKLIRRCVRYGEQDVARMRFPDTPSYVDWVCWFSTLFWDVFPRGLRFSPLTKNEPLIWFVVIQFDS